MGASVDRSAVYTCVCICVCAGEISSPEAVSRHCSTQFSHTLSLTLSHARMHTHTQTHTHTHTHTHRLAHIAHDSRMENNRLLPGTN